VGNGDDLDFVEEFAEDDEIREAMQQNATRSMDIRLCVLGRLRQRVEHLCEFDVETKSCSRALFPVPVESCLRLCFNHGMDADGLHF
jgi:hypothetical protein